MSFKNYKIIITDKFIETLIKLNINPGFNATKDCDKFGWLRLGEEISITTPNIMIEQNSGIHGGKYFPLVGGTAYSGFCSIGSFSYSYSCLPEPMKIGRYCSISTGLRILDSTHPISTLTTSAAIFRIHNKLFTSCKTQRIENFANSFNVQGEKCYPEIGHDVWIGHGVTLSMGIKVGTGAIIAANSNVIRDVPPYAIVGGNPAQIIKMRFEATLVQELLHSKWWDFEPQEIFSLDFTHPQSICKEIQSRALKTYSPTVINLASYAE